MEQVETTVKGGVYMNMENHSDMNLVSEDDCPMKIFEITHPGDGKMHIDDMHMVNDDSDMKIFIML